MDWLANLLTTPQVIVLTHDDRLPESIYRSGMDGTVLEVLRDTTSAVRVEKRIDPTERCRKAAQDPPKDTKLPAEIARQVIAAHCSQAL